VAVVGVLALQGDYEAHARAVTELGHEVRLVKRPSHLEDVAALILPGGESTTMLKLLASEELLEPLTSFGRSGRPLFGTCAGTILLATRVTAPEQASLALLDVDVERNAYGRQLDSFVAPLASDDPGLDGVEGVFIRAPAIRRVGPEVEVVASQGGLPVLVRQGPVWAATFHPEMTSDTRVLSRVLEDVAA
jgi:5'-phosphate synthase pdxT subunit